MVGIKLGSKYTKFLEVNFVPCFSSSALIFKYCGFELHKFTVGISITENHLC